MWTTTLAEGDRDDGGDPMDGTQPRAKRPASDLGAAVGNVVSTAVRNAEYTLLVDEVLQHRSEERQLLDSLVGDTPVWSLDAGEPGAAAAAAQPGRGAEQPPAAPAPPAAGHSLSPLATGRPAGGDGRRALVGASSTGQRRAKPTWWVEANKKAQLEEGSAPPGMGRGGAPPPGAARPFAAPISAASLSARQARGRATPEPAGPDGSFDFEDPPNPKDELARLTAIASQLAVRATEATRQAELERQAEEQRAKEAAKRAEEQERVAREVEAVRLAATRAAQQAAESSAREALNEAVRRQRDAERAASLAAAQASADARMRSAAAASAAAEASRIANQQRVAAEAARAAASAAAAAAAEEARQRREEQRRRVEAARKAAEEREAVRRAAEEQAWRQLELAEEAAWSIVAAQQGGEGGQGAPGTGPVPDAEATLHAAACRRATEVVARRVAAGELATHAAVQAALEEATHEAYSELLQQQQQPLRRGGTPEPGGERYNAYKRREDIEEEEVARARAHAAALAMQVAQEQAQRQWEEQQVEKTRKHQAEADHAVAAEAAAAASAHWAEDLPVADSSQAEEHGAAEVQPATETVAPVASVEVVAVQHQADDDLELADGAAVEEDEEELRRREWAAAEEARVAALWAEHDEMESRTAVQRQRRDEEESQRQALLRILAGEDDSVAAAAAAQVLQLASPPASPRVLLPNARTQRRDVFGRDLGEEGEPEDEARPASPLPPPAPSQPPPPPPAPPVVNVDELVAAAQLAARQSAAAARKAAASMGDPSSTETVNNAYALACTAEHTARELLAGLLLPLPEDCATAPSTSPVVGAAAASVALLACATGCECAAVQLGMLGPRHRGSGAAGLVSAALAMQAACSDAAHQEEYMAVLQQARLRKAVESEARVVAEAAGQVASRTAKHAMARQQQQQQEQQARQRAEALRAHEARERARHAASMRHAAARHAGGFEAPDLAGWAPQQAAAPQVEAPMDEESALARARARVEALLAAEARGEEYEEAPAADSPAPQQQPQQQQQPPPSPPASSMDAPIDWPASPTASAAVLRPVGVRRVASKGSRGARSPPPSVVPDEPAWHVTPPASHAASGLDLQAAEHRLKALEAAMEAHRLLAADQAIQALPLQARLLVEQTVAGITAAAGNAGEDVEVASLRRLMPLQAAGVPVPRSMSATMAAANSVGESALQTLAAVRASRRQLTALP